MSNLSSSGNLMDNIKSNNSNFGNFNSGGLFNNAGMQHLIEFIYVAFLLFAAFVGTKMIVLIFILVTVFIIPKFIDLYIIPVLQLLKFSNSTINALLVPGLQILGIGFANAIGIFMVLLKLCVTEKLSCGYFQLAFASGFYASFSFVASLIIFLCFKYIPSLEMYLTNSLPVFLKPYSTSIKYVLASFIGGFIGITLSKNAFMSGVKEEKESFENKEEQSLENKEEQ